MAGLQTLEVNKEAATADRVLVCGRENEPGREVPGKPGSRLYIQSEQCRNWVAETPRVERQGTKGSQVGLAPAHTCFLGCVSLVSWKV